MQHWRLETDAQGIAWLTVDTPDSGQNKLSKEALAEFSALLDRFDASPPTGLIIRSIKPGSFIAGADIEEFSRLDNASQAQSLISRGWDLFNRLEAVRYPTLALIQGVCMGGGLELSLACRFRVAVDDPATRMSLPEVMLGIVPGWGGMMRLPRVIGPQAALDMMLTGRSMDARKARRAGLVDAVTPPRLAGFTARRLVCSGRSAHRAGGLKGLMNAQLMRPLVAMMALRQLRDKAPEKHYPAPYVIVQAWARHDGDMLKAPHLLHRITTSPTARNLIRIFFLQERLKSLGKTSEYRFERVHVIGAGVMGGDIAAWCALRGLTVSLQDQDIHRIAPAMMRAAQLFRRRLKDPFARRAAGDRLIADPQGDGIAHADLVIEAISENLDAKHALLRAVEPRLKPSAILASNTSSLRIEDLATCLQSPERLVGIHFFNPVASMPLVEVIRGERSDPAKVVAAAAFVRGIDKLPLPLRSAPGFLVNAVLAPYMLAAMQEVDRGLAPETIDAAMRAFGMPMGPLELADTVGLDVVMAAGSSLTAQATPPACLQPLVSAGHLGRKSGKGFYDWSQKRPAPQARGTIPPDLADRLIAPLVARTGELVRDGVVEDADLADAGVIFGTGFAPFLGGPLHWQSGRHHPGIGDNTDVAAPPPKESR